MAELLLLDVEWCSVDHKHTGLPNSDEALNAVLQVLFHTPRFLRILPDLADHECQPHNCVCCKVLSIWESFAKGSVMVELISGLSPLLPGDTFKKLMSIISALHYSVGDPGKHTDESCILDVFGGRLTSKYKCSSCDEERCDTELLLAVQVSLVVAENLQEAINNSFEPKVSSFKCSKCGVIACNVYKEIRKLPRVLIIHLVRPSKHTKSFNFHPTIYLPGGEEFKAIGLLKNESTAVVRCPNNSLVSIQNRKIKSVSWKNFEGTEMGATCNTLLYSLEIKENSTNPSVKIHESPESQEEITSYTPIPQASVHSTTKWSVSKITELDNLTSTNRKQGKLKPRQLYGESPTGEMSTSKRKSRSSPRKSGQQSGMGCRIIYVRRIASFKTLIKKPEKFKFFTGLSIFNFNVLFEFLGGDETIKALKVEYARKTPKKFGKQILSSEDKLLMFLVRLRRGLPLYDLGYVFGISKTRCGEIVYAMLRLLYLTFKNLEKHMFLSAEEQRKKKPLPFKPFKNLIVIIDGLEIYVDRPSNFQHQGNTYSDYKSHNTVRFIIGISCRGGIIFVSPGFEGNMSEKEALKASGFYEYLQAGDVVMSDRGFDINNDLLRIGVDLVKPPSLDGRDKFTPEEEIATKAIAAARIYVEHAVKLIKVNRLFKPCVPLNMLPTLSDYVYVAGALANFGSKTFRRTSKK
ncbi:putative ubiquitin carboxyl-terminal hydrolase 16 [Frankliniella fusca]|uniref:Ubiquitin carboxyl-terminal hydrolase 16 n=1 Tax=Frankliniella fusca TaxID=407009 RepID=A0AAE1HWU5_9NEOP|nr:putative ubiquitin carboxyl-terminal hydrolase 16 [Frankliniella fusca]KAK3931098.1 putative ubiquitin carboxyl-terminal hydrolase 16 [Frankliniella fusca]